MRNAIISILLISASLSAVLGLIVMDHMGGQGHSACPFEAVRITDCSQIQNFISFIASHLRALSKFSLAVLTDGFTNLISLLLLLSLAIGVLFNKSGPPRLKPLLSANRLRIGFVLPQETLFTGWFSLHENSPTFMEGR
ncbi:MAG: hypothetical protein A3B99_04655 [Candidatus Yanofskybacteria bacterium RIFCSPHIGHO2_02_FULL_44_12b]|uniref:Uncharacterized protein n=2 Tax=Candidatus Yanofskyibacteriota TaxID=1752733 RepID=A0A1F8GK12_9BACT|nr:MAG: hypothetical protein UW79_C0013G0068 [Candidatus Yanofskybacteria bacterium GW2011_GWA2_44_9]OGN04357.1 MAG: hypothetical protein A2659_03455 [Candidatus Yanofskybacteria bacterium RIFCSPHIGHO2_01_FULL_44_24]OGN14466.1 MAG: hypothetical protein A3B99_04655 [Candidatus Yanofskybacteria bacterium RIFCSPHIGHO2_02_FULL_44_12b]OGN25747.1 MAG: hypothetical protein A2925_00995 [Candidatus Yanofskybacteria bacterium RIFCSPLOWO2_01_FULL_44_22]